MADLNANHVLGLDCVAYFSTTKLGAGADPDAHNWTEADNIMDVQLQLQKDEADTTTRANAGWEATVGTLAKATVTFKMLWKPGDAFFTAIKNSFLPGGNEIALMFLDGPYDAEGGGNQGFVANFDVLDFTRGEPLKEAVTIDVTVKPVSEQQWHTTTS